ncbi:MAG: GNAT family N-acetyltransferase [Proteobacteria bacterium]|nr:GNAT family N-acetyltransferase [Pseudomonadota bacterium]
MQVDLVGEPQHASLVDLLVELHAFYNEGTVAPRETVRAHLLDRLLAPGSPQQLAVASTDGHEVVGLAAFGFVHSLVDFDPALRRHCQLKELYVRAGHRSAGVGHALMAWLARHAATHGCHRIDWPVKATNLRGIAFYEGLGAQRVPDRLSYRLVGPALGALANHA